MQAILKFVYGVPLTEKVRDVCVEHEMDVYDYFEILYSGISDFSPGFVGVPLCEVSYTDEEVDFDLMVKDIKGGINQEIINQANQAIDELPDEIKVVLDDVKIYGIWCTS